MCTVSFVGDHYTEKWMPWVQPYVGGSSSQFFDWAKPITREEFDQLRKDVDEMKLLLKRAKQYDVEHGEPDCAMDEKVAVLKYMADFFGVSLEDIFDE